MDKVAAPITIKSPAAMAALGARFAPDLRGGDCIGLKGDLGAGKTTFTRGLIAKALGDDTLDIPSPGFTLVHEYPFPSPQDGMRVIRHVDLWRIESEGELPELGLDESPDRHITLIEWPEKTTLPGGSLVITIEHVAATERLLEFYSASGTWARRLASVLKDPHALG